MSIRDLLFAAAGNIGGNSIYLGNLSLVQNWTAITYGDGTFVAVASSVSSTAAYSIDGGKTFTQSNLPVAANWIDVVYCGNNTFVAFPQSNSIFPARSTDGGKTWSSLPAKPTSVYISSKSAFGNGILMTAGSAKISYSLDKGNTWTNVSVPITASSISYGNGVFVAIGLNSSNVMKTIYSSDGGKTWSTSASGLSGSGPRLVFGNGVFVASSDGLNNFWYSQDNGATWSMSATAVIASVHKGASQVAFGDGVFVGFKHSRDIAVYSEDGGKNWKTQKLQNAFGYQSVAYGDGVFAAVSQSQSQVVLMSIAPSV